MIDTRWRKVGRDLWLHRTRSATVVLAVLVGLVSAGAVLDTWALLRRVTRDGYLATNPASATLHLADGDSVDAVLIAAVRAHPDVRDAQARRTVVASALVAGSWRTALLFTAPALDAQRIGALAREDGAWPPAAGDFTIEKSSQDFAGIAIGDSVALRVGDGAPLRLAVTGVARDAGLAPGWMEHVVYGFVAPATLSRLGVGTGMNQLQVVVRDAAMDRATVRRIAIALREVAERTGHTVREIDVPEPGEHIHAAQMNSLLLVMGAFGLLALILSGFLVVNLVTALLAGQLREIGVMKAIGARPPQLAAMYLVLAVVLGVVASAIAIPTAALIGRAYGRFSAELLNFAIEGYAIPRSAMAVQLAAGILLPLAAAVIPVARGSRIPVAAALRDVGVGDGGITPPWIDRVRGTRRPLLLSLRNAFRRRQRMALTLLTLALGGATFLGALDLRQSIRDSVGHLYGEVMRFDMSVRLDTPQPAARAESVARGIGGVEAAEGWSGARAVLASRDELGGTFVVTALPAQSALVRFDVKAGRWLAGDDIGAMVVNERLLAEQPTLAVGSEVSPHINGRATRWRIVGVVESGPAPAAYATRQGLAAVTGDDRITSVMVRAATREPGAQSELVVRLREVLEASALPVASSQLMVANRRVVEDHLLMVASFLLVMAQLTVVVGGLALASTMSLAVLERTREIGVLRAIGAAPGAIMRMVQVEGLVIALLSWLIAIPLSIPVSLALGRAFGDIMFPVPPSPAPNGGAVVTWLALVVVVSFAACAWPARRATRIPAAAALA